MPNFTLEYVGTQPLQSTWEDDHPDGTRLNTPRRFPGQKRFLVASLPQTLAIKARVNGVLGPTDLSALSRFEWTFHQRGQGGPPVISSPTPLTSSHISFQLEPRQLGLWLLLCRRVPYRILISSIDSGTNGFRFAIEPPPDGTEVWLVPGETASLPTAVGGDLNTTTGYFVRDKTGAGPWDISLARTAGGPAIDLTSIGSGTICMQPGRPGIDDHCGSGELAIGFCVE